MSEMDGGLSTDPDNRSASGESTNISLLFPETSAYLSESDTSPALRRKTRRAPLPPNMSPGMAARHSYAFDLNALRNRTSTDTESSTSESRLFYQTSTDSDTILLPESARGSNFPGELAGVDNVKLRPVLRPTRDDLALNQSPRARSKLERLREVFRSPQIVRRKTMKEKSSASTLPRQRKIKLDNTLLSTPKKSKIQDGGKSPKPKNVASSEPLPVLSDWNMAAGHKTLEPDHDFEVSIEFSSK